MPIVSSEIVKSHNKGNGRRRVFERHIDHNGEPHDHNYSCPVNYDINQELLNRIPKLNVTLIENEKILVQQSIENGVDPDNLVLKHLDNTQKAKQIIKALMFGEPEKLLKAAEYVQGFTNTQIENFFTENQRVRIRTRQNYILDNQSVFNDDIREELNE